MPPRPPGLCAPQIVRRARIVHRAQIVRRAEAEPPSTMMLSHFSGGNHDHAYQWLEYCRKYEM